MTYEQLVFNMVVLHFDCIPITNYVIDLAECFKFYSQQSKHCVRQRSYLLITETFLYDIASNDNLSKTYGNQ